MAISVSVVFAAGRRKGWHVRLRAANRDTTKKVPDGVFEEAGLDPSANTPRHEKIALAWGVDQKKRLEKTVDDSRGPRMSWRQLWNFYKQRNPFDVQDITLEKYGERAVYVIAFFQDELQRYPDDTDIDLLELFRDRRRADGASSRTIQTEMWLTRHLLKFGAERPQSTGVRQMLIYRLPKITKSDRRGRALDVDEFFAILDTKLNRNDHRVKALLVLGVTTMIRRETLLGLRKEWIDRENDWLTIPKEFMKGPRGKKRRLSVPLCAWAMEVIDREWPFSGDSIYLFPSHVSDDAPATKMEGSIKLIVKRAGITHFTPHDLRRTGTSWLEEHGVNRLIRRILLGHEVEQDVLDLYTFVSKGSLREAVAIFDTIRRDFVPKSPPKNVTGNVPSEGDPSTGKTVTSK